ncbi:hypothetical protein EVAR_100659_1 [Eumeta japonica]|uniref:Uncharacterized protein n=1 Tax=Eumeta variegata TaxID=151549 RepID=A0A4C1ZPF6_EUMVA|nr:hypothetical protein EVAR_100659_1 [Eumeta japonica]
MRNSNATLGRLVSMRHDSVTGLTGRSPNSKQLTTDENCTIIVVRHRCKKDRNIRLSYKNRLSPESRLLSPHRRERPLAATQHGRFKSQVAHRTSSKGQGKVYSETESRAGGVHQVSPRVPSAQISADTRDARLQIKSKRHLSALSRLWDI